MIKFTANLGDGSKASIQCVTSWEEMTFRQFMEIEKNKDHLDDLLLFSILTGMEFNELANSDDNKILDVLEDATKFIYDTPDWEKLDVRDELLLGGKKYKVPNDLEKIKLGQRIMLKQLARKDNINEALPEAIAIMMVDPIYGEFNRETQDKVPEVVEMVMESRALESYGVGQFFFLHSSVLKSIGRSFMIRSQQ